MKPIAYSRKSQMVSLFQAKPERTLLTAADYLPLAASNG